MSQSHPPLSVLMPVYNAEKFLAKALESILNQTFTDFEFIIINDGSADRSLQILQRHAQQDNRIRLINRENRGLVNTLNEGIQLAKSSYIARMDADDVSYRRRLQKQFTYLQSHPECVALGTKTQLIDEDGDPLILFSTYTTHNEIDQAHLQGKGGAIAHPAVMFRKEIVAAVGGYRAEFIHAEDLDLWLRMAEHGELCNLPELLLDYRQHLQSVGHIFRDAQIDSTYKAIKEAYARRGYSSACAIEIDKTECNKNQLLLKWGWWALRSGNLKTARKYAFKSLKENPFSLETLKFSLCVIRGY
jgi:glycosyltransferase involved in cell wall biosynthesis